MWFVIMKPRPYGRGFRGALYAMVDQDPTFEARPVGIGGAWYVLVSWPDGRIEKVTGFASGALANRWIISPESQRWIARKRMTNG